MAYLILLGGIFLGILVFLFTFTASKKSGKYFLAPVVPILFFIGLTAYGYFIVGGFEGLGFAILGFGFLIAGVIGTLFLPALSRRNKSNEYDQKDKFLLILLPLLFVATIGSTIYFNQNYWIIDQGTLTHMEEESHHEITTISEGSKQVALTLGEEYSGKDIEVENVSQRDSTEITVNIIDDGIEGQVPYIWIGVDEIKEPLKIRTTDGTVIE